MFKYFVNIIFSRKAKLTWITAVFGLLFLNINAQDSVKSAPNNWYQLDRTETGYAGISLGKAYDFLKNKKSNPVLVAVIDNGFDTTHEDLKEILWHNPKEKPGNHIDDDRNGYTDDIYGWNFIGGSDGRNVQEDSDEGARVYYKLKDKYGVNIPDTTSMGWEEKRNVRMFLKAKEKIDNDAVQIADLPLLEKIYSNLVLSDSVLQEAMNKKIYTGLELKAYNPIKLAVLKAKSAVLYFLKENNSLEETNKQFLDDFGEYLKGQERKKEATINPPKTYRADIVKDNENDFTDRYYGNNDVMAGTPVHGTHCSGIIGAVRNNGKGMDGIADNVKIMMLRAVPDGDEHDKDIALSIKYAVDNGAQIISMSFGKSFSPQKKWVDEAVRYAMSKNVLLVEGSGNDAKNLDSSENYPNPYYADGQGMADNYITVGASGDSSNGGLVANFSNYGKRVDVFAPGVKIYSTMAVNTYGNLSGTSMACPVVAGLAALLLEYYPALSARQLKYVIENSVTRIKEKVKKPGTDEEVFLSDISKTGGIVNAYEAVKLAAEVKGERVIKASGKNK